MQYLEKAKDFITNLGYTILEPIKDSEGIPFAYKASFNKKEYYLLAAKRFHYQKNIGICKSIDKEIVNRALKERVSILLYIHEPAEGYEPSCYQIIADNIWAIRNALETERFHKPTGRIMELRPKYEDIPLVRIGMRNIRTDLSREMNEGEKLWAQHLKEMDFIYIGDQHGNPIYKRSIGFCPDFIQLGTNFIVEEGVHDKGEENRRKALAKQHNMILYFIPYNFKHYRRNPEAVQGVINEIKELIQRG